MIQIIIMLVECKMLKDPPCGVFGEKQLCTCIQIPFLLKTALYCIKFLNSCFVH